MDTLLQTIRIHPTNTSPALLIQQISRSEWVHRLVEFRRIRCILNWSISWNIDDLHRPASQKYLEAYKRVDLIDPNLDRVSMLYYNQASSTGLNSYPLKSMKCISEVLLGWSWFFHNFLKNFGSKLTPVPPSRMIRAYFVAPFTLWSGNKHSHFWTPYKFLFEMIIRPFGWLHRSSCYYRYCILGQVFGWIIMIAHFEPRTG